MHRLTKQQLDTLTRRVFDGLDGAPAKIVVGPDGREVVILRIGSIEGAEVCVRVMVPATPGQTLDLDETLISAVLLVQSATLPLLLKGS